MKARFFIKPKMMGGQMHYMIYRKWLWIESFFERWNTPETAQTRLKELQPA
jgi:hypothetical protein